MAQLGGALRRKTGNDQCCAGAKIAGLNGGTHQLLHALYNRHLAVHLNVCAQALQFIHILEAVGTVYALGHQACPLRQCQHRGDLGLHIRGEAGIGQRFDVGLCQRTAAPHQQGVVIFCDGYAHLHQLGADALHVLGDDVLQQQLAAGGRHGGHIGARLDLVGNNAVRAAGQALHAADLDGIRARALDVGAHGVQEVGQIHDVRLLGGVFDRGGTLGQCRGHHNIHGGPHAHHVQIYRRTHQTAVFGGGVDEAALHGHLSAHGGEALDMLVDGPDAEVAAAGHGHGGLAEAAQQRTQQVVAGADTAGKIVGRAGGVDGVAVDLNGVLVQHAHLCAQLLQNREEQGHIADLGDVLDTAYAIHQQGGRDDSYSGVFRTADGHFTKKLSSAADHVFIQGSFPLFKSSVLVCGGAVPASKAPNIVCPDSARSIRRNTSAISIPYFSIKARKPQEIFKRTEKLHRKKLPGDGYPSPGSLCPLRSALVHCTFSHAASPSASHSLGDPPCRAAHPYAAAPCKAK